MGQVVLQIMEYSSLVIVSLSLSLQIVRSGHRFPGTARMLQYRPWSEQYRKYADSIDPAFDFE